VTLDFDRDGVALNDAAVSPDVLHKLAGEFEDAGVRVGARPFALSPTIQELLAPSGILTQLAGQRAGNPARPVRALAFDKTPDANWHLPWHQDRVIAVKARVDVAGFGNWTVKNGQHHVEAPARLLAMMLNLRLHIDDCDAANGALKVLPGTHHLGRLSDAEVKATATSGQPVICAVKAGGVLAMRALTIHASDASTTPRRRRVLHVDYCWGSLPRELEWALEV